MARNLKVLGSVLVAVFAISALTASAASAAAEFHSEGTPTQLTGTQESENNNKLDVPFGGISCKTTTYNATVSSKTVTTVSVTPTYAGCTFAGFENTITTTGCTFLLHVNAAVSEGFNEGTVDVVCIGANKITMVAKSAGVTKCTVTVASQTGIGPARVTNIGTGTTRELTLDLGTEGQTKGLKNISFTQIAGTGLGACPNASGTNAKLTGEATITGEVDGGTTHTGIFLQ